MTLSFPSFEFTSPVCTCGKTYSTRYYFLTAKKSFSEFAEAVGMKELVDLMGFSERPEEDIKQITGGRLCCLKTLRLGTMVSISVNKPDITDRIYPNSLSGPLSTGKVLYWADIDE